MVLAERPRTRALLYATALATSVTLALVISATSSHHHCKHVAELPRVAQPASLEVDCPPHARAAIRVEQPTALFCRALERGTFVIAQYQTTERWDRMTVIADDGRLLHPLFDQPALHGAELVGVTASGREVRARYATHEMTVTFADHIDSPPSTSIVRPLK